MAAVRGRRTSRRAVRTTARADAIEIKATIAERQIEAALRRYRLTPRNDEERYIYFFDTPTLKLLEAGIIVRARRVIGDVDDSTVKFRPVDPASVSDKWRKYRDFKIEVDASERSFVRSASFSMPARKGLIKRVASGKQRIRKLLTPEQEAFIWQTAKREIDFDRLIVLGPLRAHRWQFIDAGCPWQITAELWIREDGQRLLEASIRAPAAQTAVAAAGFRTFLTEVGAERATEQHTKTRWALSYYVGKHKKELRKGRSATAKSVVSRATKAKGPKTRPTERRR